MTKRNKIIYWIATIWLALGLVATGAGQLFKMKAGQGGADTITHLGYPVYLLTLLGVWKILGAVTVLIPKFPLLKEWTYAGIFFLTSGAIFSHIATGDPSSALFPSLLLLILAVVSWYLDLQIEKLFQLTTNLNCMNPKVDWFFNKDTKWQKEVRQLRIIILDCGLTEELKWGNPCYTYQKSNIVLIHTFKEYCALLFFKGALLNDPKGILIQQTENVQAARQIRFTDIKEIVRMEKILKTYIYQAIEVEKAGLKIDLKKTTEFKMPEEFKKELDKNPALKKAFKALTPGRQRGYLLYFSSAKQSKTREARIKKIQSGSLTERDWRINTLRINKKVYEQH